jgi:dienelactone hydrolase
METQTSQCEDLASHGYIVVAIDHTYASAGTIFPDHIVSAKEATTNFNVVEPAEIITQIMADDSSFVIDQLTEMNEGKPDTNFKNRLDLDKIGAIGHSVGGAVAYNLAINDRRVKAAIDLDGVVYVTPKDDPNDIVPFLMLANDRYHIQAIESRKPLMKSFEEMDSIDQKITLGIYGSQQVYEDAYNKAKQKVIGLTDVLRSSGNLFTIEGCDHMKFTDIGLFIAIPQLRELIGIGGKTDPARCLEITKALTLAFFSHYLNDGSQIKLEEPVQKYPELKRIELYNP